MRVAAPDIDIHRGHGQVPLRHAIRITLGWALRRREAFWHSVFWGTGIGIMNGWASPPAYRPSVFFSCMLIAFGVGYLAPIAWRWRLGGRPRSTAHLLLRNGVVAFLLGYAVFYASLVTGTLLFHGPGALHAGLLRLYGIISIGGFIFASIGLYIVTDQDHTRASARFERARRRQERLAEEARIVALRAQINPHFFFNTLNTIAALIPDRPRDAERAVELLATALRPALMREQPMMATLESELRVARAYTEIEQLRLGPRARFEFSIAPPAESLLLPSLSLQPLVENAVAHGAARTSEPFLVRVEAHVHDGRAVVEVLSAPQALSGAVRARATEAAPALPGHALHNIAARTRALLGPMASLRVLRVPGAPAAIATLEFPAEPAP